jgi:hypothetical protein
MKLSAEYLKAKKAAETALPVPDKRNPAKTFKTLKSVTIEATFPELKTGVMYQNGRGRGSSNRVAAANAIKNLLKQPGLKAKRFSTIKATISFGTVQVEE